MKRMGLPVPPGFTLTTDLCTEYYRLHKQFPESYPDLLKQGIRAIEQETGAAFGSTEKPLLLSVRSGARVSMPGMMDTILNLGLNEQTTAALAKQSGDERFALDCHRRFVQMFGNVVLGIPHHLFEDQLDRVRDQQGVLEDKELTPASLRSVLAAYMAIVQDATGSPFPADVWTQLDLAIKAVFDSWQAPRAVTYRRLHDFPEDWGTAVNVQAMVFGNLGDDSATGVAFTRDPSTGANIFYGEYLENAQGEDVVAGIRTPHLLSLRQVEDNNASEDEAAMVLETRNPALYRQLMDLRTTLEQHYQDMQDIEFTVQSGKLYVLQTRSGKRTSRAAVAIAVAMVEEGICTVEQALLTIDPAQLDQLLHPILDPTVQLDVIGEGLPASPGAASGIIVTSADEAEMLEQQGKAVILFRPETSPEDIHGMHAARGIVTARGGMTSHAAVVARGMGRACICGMKNLQVDTESGRVIIGKTVLEAGELVTIDGSQGMLMRGEIPTIIPDLGGHFTTIMAWADQHRTVRLRANAETETDLKVANQFEAEGIGLARTEHMFFQADRINVVRKMILADSDAARASALAILLPHQQQDFETIFRHMEGLPVTVRLLDPPLHEFLPRGAAIAEIAPALDMTVPALTAAIDDLHEVNPMLGHRGCRLLLSYPAIVRMQVEAILRAMAVVHGELGTMPQVEIMIPLVADVEEFKQLQSVIAEVSQDIEGQLGMTLPHLVGTMIELPRAALTAAAIAQHAEFFSFGTNDLTQTTWGISRDDGARFLSQYVSRRLLSSDPFVTLDTEGVGRLIVWAVEAGRQTRADLKIGICGEHGGDPASVAFCVGQGLDYVSCSPYRLPIARLSAAQAAIRSKNPVATSPE